MPHTLEAWSVNHWASQEVQNILLFFSLWLPLDLRRAKSGRWKKVGWEAGESLQVLHAKGGAVISCPSSTWTARTLWKLQLCQPHLTLLAGRGKQWWLGWASCTLSWVLQLCGQNVTPRSPTPGLRDQLGILSKGGYWFKGLGPEHLHFFFIFYLAGVTSVSRSVMSDSLRSHGL